MNKIIHMYVYYQHANQSKNHVSSRSIERRRQGLKYSSQVILLLLTIIISTNPVPFYSGLEDRERRLHRGGLYSIIRL